MIGRVVTLGFGPGASNTIPTLGFAIGEVADVPGVPGVVRAWMMPAAAVAILARPAAAVSVGAVAAARVAVRIGDAGRLPQDDN